MYRRPIPSWVKHLDFYLIDAILMAALLLLVGFIRYGRLFTVQWKIYLGQMLLALEISHLCVTMAGSFYKNIIKRGYAKEIIYVFAQVSLVFLILSFYLFGTKRLITLSRIVFFATYGSSLVVIYLFHIGWKTFCRYYLKGNNRVKLYLISDSRYAEEMVRSIKKEYLNRYSLEGIIIPDNEENCMSIQGVPVICSYEDMWQDMILKVVDEVMICVQDPAECRKLTEYFLEMGAVVHINLAKENNTEKDRTYETICGQIVETISNRIIPTWQLIIKRVIDIIGGIVGVIIMGVLYLIVAPKIKKIDPGPVFFKQKRVGQNGRIFYIYKFRSMYLNADERKKELMAQNEMSGLMFKMENDPRILPGIGKKIRDTSIDEFPQFLNVLKGEMSLVGTRPPTLDEFQQYSPHHKVRLSFKPGITGMWQVSGRSDISDFEEVVRLDNEYIQNWNILLDIKILLKTVAVVFKKEGAK